MQREPKPSVLCRLARFATFLTLLWHVLPSDALAQDQTLEGIAVGPDNAPVSQLLMELRTEENTALYALTGDDGRFVISVAQNLVTPRFQLKWDPTGPREGSVEVAASELARGGPILVRLGPSARDAPPPQLRFHYHTTSGYDASILLTGFAPPRLRDSALYADRTMIILATPPFEFGAMVLERFGSRYTDSYLTWSDDLPIGANASIDSADQELLLSVPSSYLLSAYGDKETVRNHYRTLWTGDGRLNTIPIPDLAATSALVDDHQLPREFRYRLGGLWNTTTGPSMPPPLMTRPLVLEDILQYRQRKEDFLARSWSSPALIGVRAMEGSVNILEPLLALFPDGKIPPGLSEVSLNYQPGDCGPSGFWFEATAPELSVELLVIENVSGRNLELGAFVSRTNGQENERQMREPFFPQRVLQPDEVLVLPLSIVLSSRLALPFDSWENPNWDDSILKPMDDQDRAALAALPPNDLVPAYIPSYEGDSQTLTIRRDENSLLFSCRAQSILEALDLNNTISPSSATRIAVGPSIAVEAIEVDGADLPVRLASETYSSVTGGIDAGSCPFLLVQDPDTGVWINIGPVIVGAIGQEAAMTETVTLPPGVTRVRILEHESETSFLYDVNFVSADLAEVGKVPAKSLAQSYIRLDHGDWVEFEADSTTLEVSGGQLALSITGFYEPL